MIIHNLLLALIVLVIVLTTTVNAFTSASSSNRARRTAIGGEGGRGKAHRQLLLLTTRRRRQSLLLSFTKLYLSTDDDEDDDETEEKKVNPYADPNFPDLEFVDYSDPEYSVDQGQEFEEDDDDDSTEAQIEAMRETRRRKNDEFQFQTYFRDVLKDGDEEYKGIWTVYKTSTFLDDDIEDNDGSDNNGTTPPKLVKVKKPLRVVSKGSKKIVACDTDDPLDAERILHEEMLDVGEDAKTKNTADELEIIANTYWPHETSAYDFRGKQGIMVVGNAYTIANAVQLLKGDSEEHEGPFKEYRAELGVQANDLRFRIKLDYRIKPDGDASATPPPLHLKTLTVCREALGDVWPSSSSIIGTLMESPIMEDDGKTKIKKKRIRRPSTTDLMNWEALFGMPGADGGLYDPPPVGDTDQEMKYMMMDLDGGATVLFPYTMDQDENAHDGNGWVSSLDWSATGGIRFQVDRKVNSGSGLLGLRTLELSEVQSVDADRYRPRDGGQNMRQ